MLAGLLCEGKWPLNICNNRRLENLTGSWLCPALCPCNHQCTFAFYKFITTDESLVLHQQGHVWILRDFVLFWLSCWNLGPLCPVIFAQQWLNLWKIESLHPALCCFPFAQNHCGGTRREAEVGKRETQVAELQAEQRSKAEELERAEEDMQKRWGGSVWQCFLWFFDWICCNRLL